LAKQPKLTLKERFTYQKPEGDQAARYEKIRKAALRLARVIEANTPDVYERIFSIQGVEMAVMLANKCIALEKFKRE
jgi:hypothetical protein